MLAVAGSSRWNCRSDDFDCVVKKLAVGDPKGVLKTPMTRVRMRIPKMVAARRIRDGLTIFEDEGKVFSVQRLRGEQRTVMFHCIVPVHGHATPQVPRSATLASRVAQRRGTRGCVQRAYS